MEIEAIKFNHDPNSSTDSALNIRKNRREFIEVPEWKRNLSKKPEDSPAAYAIEQTRNATVMIEAQLSRQNLQVKSAWVRAIDPNRRPLTILLNIFQLITSIFIRIFTFRQPTIQFARPENRLGVVLERQVNFLPTGKTNFEKFTLKFPSLDKKGVGISTTTWQWQYRLNKSDPWKNMAKTQHRIYVVLDIPKEPWHQKPYINQNTELPWTDVLDYAVYWARGNNNSDKAAGAITDNIYNLGLKPAQRFEYNCGQLPQYGDSTRFFCTQVINRLKGNPGRGKLINCIDCANFLVTFSNILGCELWSSEMSTTIPGGNYTFFKINPVSSLGLPKCSGLTGFEYHVVGWKDACTEKDPVFDACLRIDEDSDPTSSPHKWLLPKNVIFGKAGDAGYRDHLVAPTPNHSNPRTDPNRLKCSPNPSQRFRARVI